MKESKTLGVKAYMPAKMYIAKVEHNVSFLTNMEAALWACNTFPFPIQAAKYGDQQSFSSNLENFAKWKTLLILNLCPCGNQSGRRIELLQYWS